MPVLAANQVTLAEVLEVKGGPLNEEEIWAVLSHAGKDIERILTEGKGKQYGQPSLVVSPDTLVLAHSGHVTVSTHVSQEKSKNPPYRAPELSSRTVSPSDGAVEKMYVYSLGMTLYFAADYTLNKSKMGNLSISLGNLLLSMCEELARTRYSLRQVLAACGSKYGDSFYSKIIKSLVVLVLGNNIPEVIQYDEKERSVSKGSDKLHPSRSLRAIYRPSLELPSPPLAYRVSRGQVTSEELIGSNDRTSPEEPLHSKNMYMTKIPHTLDKYRKYLEKARHQRTVTSPVVADRSINLHHRYGSMPVVNGRHSLDLPPCRGYDRSQSLDRNSVGYGETHLDNGLFQSGKLRGSSSLGNLPTAPSSDASSEMSSLSDNHVMSTLSSAQSSSLVSLMEGSYVPASSVTNLGSDIWGSMASLKDIGGSQRSGEWHHSSIGDLRSASQLSDHDHASKRNGFADTKSHWPSNSGQRKFRSEQNLVSPDTTDGKKTKKVPKAKLRSFFGPEFVQVMEDPNQSLVNITPKKEEKPVSGRRMVTVVMLNEQRLEMTVESSTKVQELFTQITKYIGITEKIYFGLTRIEDDEHLFLDFDTKLSKYAPPGWKEQSKKFTGKYVLYFRVKFYVENLALLRHHETSHQLYLQLRSDVIKDHVFTDVDPVLYLASLALQAEYGDYSKKRFGENYFKPKHYLPHRILVKLSEDLVSPKLRALHKLQCGLSQDEAEVKFIKESQKLPEYGNHLHKTQWSEKENQIIYLGICVRGLTIYELRQSKRRALEKYSWQSIKKLAFKKKKFYIEPREDENGDKQNRLTFVSSSYKRSKYLLYLCTSFHRFQMRMKVRLMAMDEKSTGLDQKKRNSLAPQYAPSTHLNGESENLEKFMNVNEHTNDVESGLDTASRGPSRACSLDGNDVIGQTASSPETTASLPYVLSSTPESPSRHSDKTLSPRANEKNVADVIMSPDRKVKAIKLKKDSRDALGLTVVGGEDTRRLHFGIFIKRIAPGSIAYEDGRLQVGDRILAVNGKSLEYVSHDDAVQALKNTPQNVELLVSQSTRTHNDIDMSAVSSPSFDKNERPSSSHERRMNPHFISEQSPSAKTSNHYSNRDVTLTNVSKDLESSYPAENASPQESNSHSPRQVSGSSSDDRPASNASTPEQSTRMNHHGGIKLPGMTDGRLEDVKLIRNGHFRASQTLLASVESPGSIASYGEKVNRQNSLPDPENLGRKSSASSALAERGLRRSRSNSGTTSADVVIEQTLGSNRKALNDVRVPEMEWWSGEEQLPVGIIRNINGINGDEDRLDNQLPSQFTVELDKASGSLGLNVMGGINTSVTDGAIFVKSLYPNGPADLDGRIQVGHKILSINGISLQGVSHKQAVETIKRAPVHAVLVIEGKPGETAHNTDNGSNKKEKHETVFDVVLMKGIGGLGMSLVGGVDCAEEYGDQLRVKAMFPGQPAENSEKLRVGDIILAANGVSLAGKTSRDAINVLRDQPTRVVLTVKRDPTCIPPGLLRRSSFSQNLDPNEVLSAIHSKLQQDDSRHSEYSEAPENDSPREIPLAIHDPHESRFQKGSDARMDNSRFVSHKNKLYQDSAKTNGGSYMSNERAPQDNDRTHRDTGVYSVQPDDDSDLQSTASNRPYNDKNMKNNLQSFEPRTGSVETVGSLMLTSDENHVVPKLSLDRHSNLKLSSDRGPYSVEGLSADSMSGDNIAEADLEPTPTKLMEEVLAPVESAQTGEEGENRENKKKQSSSGRSFEAADQRGKLAPDEEVLDIVLHKGSSGLGFTLAGGADTVGGCFVREIIGDPARSDGRLRPKDQIVMVNGQDTTKKKHMEAVNILRSTRNEVHLTIRRRPDKVKSKTRDGLDIKTISMIRTTRGVIGLTLAEDKQGQIYAAEVVPDEPAAKHGGLKRGDVILEINGERVDGTDLTFATDCLDRAHPVVTIVIKQFRSETESKYALCSPTESDHEVPLDSLQSHALRTTIVQPDICTQGQSSYNPELLPSSDEPSPEDLTSVQKLSAEVNPTLEHVTMSEEQSTERRFSQQLNGSLSPAQGDHEDQHVMKSLPAGNSFSEEKMTSPYPSQEHENEEYPSDDDDLLLKEEVIITALEKGPRGLGFSLFSGQTLHDTPGLFIRSIQPNSVVAEDGKIKVGDQLMKVNGEDVERLDHSEVITLLRSLSGVVRLELLRISEGEDESPDVSNRNTMSERGELLNNSVSPVTTPDFSEDVGIVLHALNTKQGLPLSDDQRSLSSPIEEIPHGEQLSIEERAQSSDEERPEAWPQPPTLLELGSSEIVNKTNLSEISNMPERTNESVDSLVGASEDDTTSVTFSEDDFLDEIEDIAYTPSPESDRIRSGNDSERCRIPIKPGSSLSPNLSPRISENKNFPRENIEMSLFKAGKPTRYSRTLTDNTLDETNTILAETSISSLVPESFLNASQAVSSSQATTPEIPPPLPTTPIPSDEDLSAQQKVSPRDQTMTMRERFEKVVRQENAKGRFDFPLRPKSPLINRRSESLEPTGPLLEIRVANSIYAGDSLQSTMEELQQAVSSGKAANEFQLLREMTPIDNCPSGKRALNKEKNRYRNVLPYEKTRVILSGDEQLDYINANYVDIIVDEDTYHYIATQGPLPITTTDFWRMVWEQRCQVIAMVTLDMESGKVKCHRYWPESPELPIKVSPSLEVHLESVETHDNYVQRIVRIENSHEEQSFNVVHLNFVAWPDHGVPKSACELVEFVKQFRSNASVGPSVVHCSAGIGRTGTLLTIDTCMKHIERGLEFDIHSIVHNLRNQRPGMIQTKDQYLFCYQACIEILKSLKS